jgi:hypothetical protein
MTYTYTIDKSIIKEITTLTAFTEQEYQQFVYDCGLAYLQSVIDEEQHEYVTQFIRRSIVFWNWWKYHWQRRDQQFIEMCYNWDEGIEARHQLYLKENEPRKLAAGLYLNGKVLEESYSVMIQDLQKEVHKEKEAV